MEHNNQKNELYECNEVRNRHAWSRSCRRTTRSFFDENDKAYIILVDAGNYCNGETIAKFVKERYNTFQIDLAICTHCDDDHFGGFIFLLEDMKNNPQTSVDIKKILINDPGLHITQNDVKYYQNLDNVRKEARSVYDGHGNNLLELIWDLSRKRRLSYSEAFSDGYNSEFDGLIDILGPSTEYYRTQALLFRNDLQPYDYAIVDDSEDAYEIPETKNHSVVIFCGMRYQDSIGQT